MRTSSRKSWDGGKLSSRKFTGHDHLLLRGDARSQLANDQQTGNNFSCLLQPKAETLELQKEEHGFALKEQPRQLKEAAIRDTLVSPARVKEDAGLPLFTETLP